MEVEIDLNKSVEENAAEYYEQAKKFKKKLKGALDALEKTKEKLIKLESEEPEEEVPEEKTQVKKEWYEKFRWFTTSEGFLCIGGRDATTNEIVIKKHTDTEDIVFHTEMPGSPFFVIKTEGRKVTESSLNEAAIATASYSKAWKLGLASVEVFHVKPDQVSKKALSGEYVAKGAFMIYGKKNFIKAGLRIAIGIKKGKIIGGPADAIRTHAEKYVEVAQGRDKASDVAKKIKKQIGGGLDEIIRFLPAGGCEVRKNI